MLTKEGKKKTFVCKDTMKNVWVEELGEDVEVTCQKGWALKWK